MMDYFIKTFVSMMLIHISAVRIDKRVSRRLNLGRSAFTLSNYVYAFIPGIRWLTVIVLFYIAFDVSDDLYDDVVQEVKDEINGE